jgi:hypothetical protein
MKRYDELMRIHEGNENYGGMVGGVKSVNRYGVFMQSLWQLIGPGVTASMIACKIVNTLGKDAHSVIPFRLNVMRFAINRAY